MNKYVQHSKKIANWGQAQWVVIVFVVLLISALCTVDSTIVPVIEKIIIWSATLAGVTVTGYMGNSSVEKYAEKKFTLYDSIRESEEEKTQG